MARDEIPTGRSDDLVTVMAVGVLAYLGETLGHKADKEQIAN